MNGRLLAKALGVLAVLMIACAQQPAEDQVQDAAELERARQACEARDDCFGPPTERTAEARTITDVLEPFFWPVFWLVFAVLVLWLIILAVRPSNPQQSTLRQSLDRAAHQRLIDEVLAEGGQPGTGGLSAYDLGRITNSYTKPVVVRQYDSDDKGIERYENEAGVLLRNGYRIEGQDTQGSHIHAGRLILTGGLSVLAGRRGIRSKGKVTVTFLKGA